MTFSGKLEMGCRDVISVDSTGKVIMNWVVVVASHCATVKFVFHEFEYNFYAGSFQRRVGSELLLILHHLCDCRGQLVTNCVRILLPFVYTSNTGQWCSISRTVAADCFSRAFESSVSPSVVSFGQPSDEVRWGHRNPNDLRQSGDFHGDRKSVV